MIISSESLSDGSATHQSDPDPDIPTGQISRSSRTPLTIGAQIDEQGIESRKHRTESQPL